MKFCWTLKQFSFSSEPDFCVEIIETNQSFSMEMVMKPISLKKASWCFIDTVVKAA